MSRPKSLEERLEERKSSYEELVEREKLVQSYLDRLYQLIPNSVGVSISVYKESAFIHLSFDDVEDFEETFITPLSEEFEVTWERYVERDEVQHEADLLIEEENYEIYIIVRSKPVGSCRIIKVPTGNMKTVHKSVEVEEAEFEYVVECSDD